MPGMATDRSPSVPAGPSLRLRFYQFELDEAEARLTRSGQPVPLPPKPFAVLCALARTPRTLVTKNALLDRVWGHRFVTESVLKSTISELRAALEDDPKQPRYIETVSRRGYRFIAAVNAPAAPSATPPATSSTMIGRAQPLERLRTAWQLASGGRRQVVWIAGEAGVGKTTLIERFMAEVGDAHCAHGQCVEQYGAAEPYLPVLEALTALCRRDAALAELIRTVAPTWLLQLPWLSTAEEREALRRDLAGAGPARMLREMGELLDRYTETRPLLLVTEDLHWSDQGTVQLMDYIARRRAATRLLWLASFRLTEIIAADHPLSAVRNELRLHGLSDEIVLDAFSEKEVAEYVAERLPARAADEAFVRALHGRTDGLPLFVADVVNEVIARGAGPGSMAIPGSLTGVIERYIRELAPAERTLLEAASVCGAEFKLATVARVLERDAASLAQSCTALARQQRWVTEVDERYVFRHALYREVLYKRIAPLARVELHRKVAAALERERADGLAVSAVELASHFELGREPMPALRYYAEAAEAALGAIHPGRVREDHRTCIAPARAGAARSRAQRTENRDWNASRPWRDPRAWRGQRSKKCAPGRVLAAWRSSAASDARASAARIRIHALHARGICRGARGGRSGASARIHHERSRTLVDRVHIAWAGRSPPGSIGRRSGLAGARARLRRAAGRRPRRIPGGSAGRAARLALHSTRSSRTGRGRARLPAARACSCSPAGMAHGQDGRHLV
jgi:DNA-binding winged helix-turn-helix (wHTH) protein